MLDTKKNWTYIGDVFIIINIIISVLLFKLFSRWPIHRYFNTSIILTE